MLARRRVLFVLAMAWREGRAARRRTFFLTVAIAVGVAALVAINSFTDNLRESVRQQARALLGADLALSSGTRLSPRSEALDEPLRLPAWPAPYLHRDGRYGAAYLFNML